MLNKKAIQYSNVLQFCRIRQNDDEIVQIVDEINCTVNKTLPKQVMFSIIGESEDRRAVKQYTSMATTFLNLKSQMNFYFVTSCMKSSIVQVICERLYKVRTSQEYKNKSLVIVGMAKNDARLWSRFCTIMEVNQMFYVLIYHLR